MAEGRGHAREWFESGFGRALEASRSGIMRREGGEAGVFWGIRCGSRFLRRGCRCVADFKNSRYFFKDADA